MQNTVQQTLRIAQKALTVHTFGVQVDSTPVLDHLLGLPGLLCFHGVG